MALCPTCNPQFLFTHICFITKIVEKKPQNKSHSNGSHFFICSRDVIKFFLFLRNKVSFYSRKKKTSWELEVEQSAICSLTKHLARYVIFYCLQNCVFSNTHNTCTGTHTQLEKSFLFRNNVLCISFVPQHFIPWPNFYPVQCHNPKVLCTAVCGQTGLNWQ